MDHRSQFMMMQPGHSMMNDHLDQMEQELTRLRRMRAQEDMAAQAQGMPPFHKPGGMSGGGGMDHVHLQLPFSPPGGAPALMNAPGGGSGPGPTSQLNREIITAHRDLIDTMNEQDARHEALMTSHRELMSMHKAIMSKAPGGLPKVSKNPSLGVIRLDYKYPPACGDTDCPASFGYDVFYRVIPGLTFEMAQSGKFTEEVERHFAEGIKYLEQRKVSCITGDCGFMMAFQIAARKIASKPVFMSSMVQCPVIATAFEPSDKILILTANGDSLRPQKDVLLEMCGFKVDDSRFLIKGCQDVPGFDAVAKGEAVPIEIVQPGIVKLTTDLIKANPSIRGILLECTELPPYADALRAVTGLSVWDAITGADFYVMANKDNPRFGVNDWQAEWDGHQDKYSFGANLIEADKAQLVHKAGPALRKAKAKAKAKAVVGKTKRNLAKKQAPVLGVVRLDYNYPPAKGDIDCAGSYDYEVLFRCVPGLTFDMAQAGKMTYAVQQEFVSAVRWLEGKGVCGITGDCGFMMAFQPLAREVANVPVFMSSMVQAPMISCAFDKYDKVLILTANSETLKPQKDHLLSECGFNVDDDRFVIRGCQDVPGFDAVAKGEKVDVEYVTPGIVHMVKQILKTQPTLRAILLECTELPPYADALRHSTGLPVFDAITCTDFFVSARKDNPRFGLNQWQNDWDHHVAEYSLGDNLTADQKSRLRMG